MSAISKELLVQFQTRALMVALAIVLFSASLTAAPTVSPGPHATGGTPTDINLMIQQVLKESYLEQMADLRDYAEKVKFFNEAKKKLREVLARARDHVRGSGNTCERAPPSLKQTCDGIGQLERRIREIDAELRRLNQGRVRAPPD